MRTPSGELHVVDFKTEQIVASIQPIDYWDDKRHWEIKNNIDTLEFRVFDNTRHSSTLMQQNLVLKEVRDGRIVPYVITEIEKNSDDRSVIAYASGEWIQLAKAGIIPPQKLEGKTVIEMVDIALAGTKWQKGNLEYASFRSMTIDEFIDPLSFLKKIASLFELEIQYRAEVVGSQIVGRYVDMVKKRGQETGKEITLGKDLLGIKRIENSQNICTALLGFVKKEGGEFITITEINNGVPYLVDNDAFQRWNEKGNHKFGFYSPETENDNMDAKRLMTLMNTELKKRVNASVLYEVEAQSIGRVFGLAHELINEGDTIRIKDTGFTPKLYLEARAIAGDESFKNPLQDKYVFGDYHEIIDPNEELRKIYNRILSSLGNKQEMIDQLDKLVKEANETASNAKKESEAAKILAEKVQENIKNNTVEIIESKYPPTTGLKDRKTLWLDISNGKPGILKLWKDGIWDPVVPDVESVKKETLEQVNKDIESTKTELNQKVQEAQNQATGQVNEVKETLQGVSRTISDVQNEQGNINKKVTQIEQTSDGFKTSIETLTKKDTEISNKLNTVEQDANGTKQTIERIETNMNNLQVGTTNLYYNTEFDGKKNPFGWATLNADLTFSEENDHGVLVVTPKVDTACGFYQRIGGKGINTIVPLPLGFYTVSLWVKGVPGMKVNITAEAATNLPKSITMELTDEWIRHKYTFEVTTKNNNGTVTFYCQDGNKGKVFYAMKPQIERGKILSDYKKSDDNYADTNTFTKVTSEIKTEAGKISEKLTEVTGKVTNLKPGGRNFLLNTDFKRYITNDKRGWDNALNGTLQLSNWQGEFNGGVQQPEKGYHAHLDVKKFGYPVLAMISKNSFIGLPGRWLGLNQPIIDDFKKGDIAGKEITISMDIWTESGSNNITGGLYHFIEGNSNQTFHSGQFSIGVDKMKKWVRYSQTLKLHDKYDVSKGAHFYIYGHTGNEGERYIKNVQIEIGNIATEWQPAPEENVSTDEFSKKTTEIEKSVDGVKTTVTNVQNSQAGFEKRVSTVEQTASGLSSTVSNLNNVVSDQGKKLTEANTKLEQQATAINAKVELKQVEDYVAGFKIPELKQTVDQNKEVLLDELANKLATEQFNQKMTMIDNRFTINEQGINAAAKRTEVYTKIQADGQFAKDSYVRDLEGRIHITETNILSTVKKGDIISAINQTAETIKIQAGKIELDGTTIAKYLEAQELRGTTIRTDNGVNYVHIQKQFIRLMESNISRVYLGYYKDRTSQIQPTVVLGGDSDFQDGSVVLSKQPTQGFLGVINGKDSNGDPYFVSSVIFKRSGDLNLNAGMNGNVTVNSGKGIGHYAKGGSFWVEATDGVTLKGGAKSVWMDCQSSIVFNLKGKNMLDIVATSNSETDLRFQTVTLRNGNVDGYKTLQVKDGTGNAFNAVTAAAFQTASKREYKTNIRDVQFDAIEKIMALKIQQYNLKTDIEELYEKRMNRVEGDPILTTNDIETHYGWIADDENTPGCFVTKEKNAAEIYSSLAIQIKAFQEEKLAKDAEIEELKEENKQMNRRIEVLEQLLVQNLIDKKPEQP
ncbi:phage tail spike protein [Bacillus cereus group sp. BfR-BA-01381]|uniref:phage tail spike protein n=1 Tax=Bacillus cereus group sp. BfR-BA-01381 TaxID=2920325 RepID=UPI001F57FDA8|nr:phage tail spike protein [Bacillus cereus group sp. BfR-BA-01381]